MANDPHVMQLWQRMPHRLHQRSVLTRQRREVFTQLVSLYTLMAEPHIPEAFMLHWRACVVNNSHAVPLPEHERHILTLAQDFVKWYQGLKPRAAGETGA